MDSARGYSYASYTVWFEAIGSVSAETDPAYEGQSLLTTRFGPFCFKIRPVTFASTSSYGRAGGTTFTTGEHINSNPLVGGQVNSYQQVTPRGGQRQYRKGVQDQRGDKTRCTTIHAIPFWNLFFLLTVLALGKSGRAQPPASINTGDTEAIINAFLADTVEH